MIFGLFFLVWYWIAVFTNGFPSFLPMPIGVIMTLVYLLVAYIESEDTPIYLAIFKTDTSGSIMVFGIIFFGITIGIML